MKTIKTIVLVILAGFFFNSLRAQSKTIFQSLLYPHSIRSGGLGVQGVASRGAVDAMQYNPAALVNSDKINFSYFRNPWNQIGWGLPLVTLKLEIPVGKYGNAGIEYTYMDFGEVYTASGKSSDLIIKTFPSYERSLALGYALRLNDNLSIGALARYAWRPNLDQDNIDHFMFSAGILYIPDYFEKRLSFGLSLINMGSSIEYTYNYSDFNGKIFTTTYSGSLPSQLNLGVEAQAVKNNFFELNLSLSAMKPIVNRNDKPDNSAQSSFKALFTDWDDFPEDITAQVGLEFSLHPVYLGYGISFIQEMYLGYFSSGPKEYIRNYFTHGFNIGLEARGIIATVGYAGRWHNNYDFSLDQLYLPWESFQFSLSAGLDFLRKEAETQPVKNIPRNIIVTAGYAFGLPFGKMDGVEYNGLNISYSNNNNWTVGADFYINNNSALITSFSYSCMKENIKAQKPSDIFPPFLIDWDIETVSLESGYRYHPLEVFYPLFIQASLGIIRLNPVVTTFPRYYYKAFDRISVGALFPLESTQIVIMPKIGIKTILMEIFPETISLHGFNQFEFSLNVGYSL